MGWNWSIQAAKHHDVWVLTTTEFRREIEANRDQWEPLGVTFIFHDVSWWPARLVDPVGRWIRLYYYLWQLSILNVARRLQDEVDFDLIHHVTLNTAEVPGFLWRLDVPFIWGPIGGGQVPPRSLWNYLGRERLAENLRRVRKVLLPFNPIVKLALRKARLVLVANQDTEDLVRRCGGRNIVRHIEAAVDGAIPDSPRVRSIGNCGGCMVVLWAGEVVARKGPLLALEAIQILGEEGRNVELWVAGEGRMSAELSRRVREMGLTSHVRILGKLDREQMNKFYAGGDVFLFTSLRDTSGTVILEAMSRGIPVVTLDHQGAAELVDDASGFKIPVTSPDEVVAGIAASIACFQDEPELIRTKGEAARARVGSTFTWERKAELLRNIYARATEANTVANTALAGEPDG